EVVDQHPEPTPWRGAEVADHGRQVVDAAEVLHHDALDAQVVTPDLLDELGVVLALDVDPALPGDLRTLPGDGHRAGRRTAGRGGPGDGGPDQHDGGAVDEEARAQREHAVP